MPSSKPMKSERGNSLTLANCEKENAFPSLILMGEELWLTDKHVDEYGPMYD